MVTTLNSRTPAREAGYEMLQYIAARLTLTAADTPVVKVGTLPAGSVIVGIASRVATAVTGGTPVLGVGSVAAGGAVPAVGGTGNVQTTMAEAAGSELVFPLAALTLPFTVDTDIYVGTSGGATAGDVYIMVLFAKPLN
jgi:hypothetical protein